MTDISRLYTAVRQVRTYARSLTGLLVILLVVLPMLLFISFTGWRSYEPIWDDVLWQSSLQNGSFWLLPGHVIFQDDTQLGGEEEPGVATTIMFLIFLAPVALGIALSYRLLAFTMKRGIIRSYKKGLTSKLELLKDSLLWNLLPDLRDERAFSHEDYTVSFSGRSLVVQVSAKHVGLPPLFFDSVSNDIARREGRRFIFSREDELVFDGTTFEHFRIYAAAEYHARLTRFFVSDVLAVIVKELDGAEIVFENGVLSAVFDVRSVRSEKDLQLLFESLTRLRELFEDAALFKNENVPPRLASIDNTIRFFGMVPVKKLAVQVMMWLVVGLYVGTAMAAGGRGMTGDMLMPVWLAGSFQLIGIHRLLKHRISLLSRKGIFTSDWGNAAMKAGGGA
jgi:hypothetical protein